MLTYDGYLKVNQLKQLQVCVSDPVHHDELLFITIHQAYELWFKVILHEMKAVVDHMHAGEVRSAVFCMRRINSIFRLLVNQIHILETMKPEDFLEFRSSLSPASGFQSTQFREIEFSLGLKSKDRLQDFPTRTKAYKALKGRYEAPSLCEQFYAMLRWRGFALPEDRIDAEESERSRWRDERVAELSRIYYGEDRYAELYDLAESFVDLDELVYLWRSHHVTVVERIIGSSGTLTNFSTKPSQEWICVRQIPPGTGLST